MPSFSGSMFPVFLTSVRSSTQAKTRDRCESQLTAFEVLIGGKNFNKGEYLNSTWALTVVWMSDITKHTGIIKGNTELPDHEV